MLAKFRPRLTYANVVSSLCLFILLGGGAYAAMELPRNSVGTKQLKKHAVTLAKVATGVKSALRGPRGAKGDSCLPTKPNCVGPRGAAGPGALPLLRESVAPGTYCASCATSFGTVGGYEIKYQCYRVNGDHVVIALYVRGSAGRVQVQWTYNRNDADPSPFTSTYARSVSAQTDTELTNTVASTGNDYVRMVGTALVSPLTGNGVVTIVYSLIAAHAGSGHCNVYGSAYPAG
jgi:hypothetical protein